MASDTLGSRKTFLVSDNPFSNSKTADCSSFDAPLVSFIGKHSKGEVRITSRLKNGNSMFCNLAILIDFSYLIVDSKIAQSCSSDENVLTIGINS